MSVAKGTVEISRANARKIIADLPTLLEPNAVVFDVETTGLNSRWHEIVSFAARSPTDAVGTSTFIMPKRPNDLLKASDSGKSAYDINGIHLDDLVGSPTFEEAYPKIRQALEGKHGSVGTRISTSIFSIRSVTSVALSAYHVPE